MTDAPRPTFNPIAGSPPTLEWTPLDLLMVDESYQRSTEDGKSQAMIARIAKGWDWRLFQPLSVARRPDNSLCVIDGQHRLAAARRRGDIPHLPVVISRFDDVAGEARAFEAMNRERKTMSRLERYRAAAVAGDPVTLEAMAEIAAAGMTLAAHDNNERWKPGTIACIGGIVRGIKQHGRKVTEAALVALAEGFEGEALTHGAALLLGLLAIYADPPEDLDPDRLIGALGEKMQDEWAAQARDVAKIYAWQSGVAMRWLILKTYNALPANFDRDAA
jgi:hypothetical protein